MSFGAGGKVTTDFAGGFDLAFAVALQTDGKIVAAGFTAQAVVGGSQDFALARYNIGLPANRHRPPEKVSCRRIRGLQLLLLGEGRVDRHRPDGVAVVHFQPDLRRRIQIVSRLDDATLRGWNWAAFHSGAGMHATRSLHNAAAIWRGPGHFCKFRNCGLFQ